VPRLTFTAGEILTAANLNVVSDATVMTFADAAARTTAIPSPTEGMVTYLASTKNLQRWTGAAWVNVVSGFTAQETITASNASWPVPSLASPIVKVTVIGAGGGGGGTDITGNLFGGTGGTTTFNAGGAGTVSAAGGNGGACNPASNNTRSDGLAASVGMSAANHGLSAHRRGGGSDTGAHGGAGAGGRVTVQYLNLTGISTVNVTVGAGGGGVNGGSAGGRGEVIVEYVAV